MNRETYERLYKLWGEKRGIHSFHHTICKGQEYEELLAAGMSIVPFILEDLKTDISMHLQFLIHDITREDIWAGKTEDGWRKYNVAASAQLWVEWGQSKGYIS